MGRSEGRSSPRTWCTSALTSAPLSTAGAAGGVPLPLELLSLQFGLMPLPPGPCLVAWSRPPPPAPVPPPAPACVDGLKQLACLSCRITSLDSSLRATGSGSDTGLDPDPDPGPAALLLPLVAQ